MRSAPPLETAAIEDAARDVVTSVPPAAERPDPLPEDDGMGALRKRILEIQAKQLPAPEQARLIHQLLMESYKRSRGTTSAERPVSPTSANGWEQKQSHGVLDTFIWQHLLGEEAEIESFHLTEDDVKPTFAPLKPGEDDSEYRALGCEHYKRNVKSECSSCGHWYTCRFCHDNTEDHPMTAKDTRHMLCMYCGAAQKVGEACVSCGEMAAMYYCSICKLWNNDSEKSIYHCPDCGICRVGRGLGKDFFHCKKCNACLNINFENAHRCIERLLDCDCPICGEYMFNTTRGICHMKCGHTLHKDCWDEHIKHAYKCPICNKSIVNMETQFRRLDMAIETQPMPEKFQDTRAVVSCNDCCAKTTVKYHWLGLKCAVCQSYNTSQLQILGTDADILDQAVIPATEPLVNESLAGSNADLLQTPAQSVAREIPRRRRHSSNLIHLNTENPDIGALQIGSYVVEERFARSVSVTGALRPANVDDSDEEKEDMIGLWSRVPQSIMSDDDQNEDYDSEDESASSVGDEMDEDDADDEEEDEINLFGHR
ncbi:zinc-ribbon-domain-containing protein [Truncatella angustata]|uniref:Zinc-ribbon-domain-containing protein n=1 Tax=Truncatella angustata TaxID=152316 RepID=A0A9P8RM72_9PEZI|nr:zinc-ribbon-domain-containing protein [Truncatella angustata]KAH6645790.1 zinc-ribbon-domain-containing protein [Truncatella angustata]